MGERAVLAVLKYFEIPDNRREENDGRFHEEVALLLHPRLIEVEHNGIGTFVCVRNILHEIRVYGIATVRTSRIVEVDYIELRLYLVSIRMIHQVVVGNGREVGKLKIITVHRKAFFNLLLDKVIHHCVGFSTARCA